MSHQLSRSKRIQYYIEYLVVKALVATATILPLKLLRRVGSALGWVALRIFAVRRRVVVDNIGRALHPDSAQMRAITRRAYANWGRCLMEFAAFKRIGQADLFAMVDIDGRQNLDAALAHGRGAILFTGHFGNWELLGATLARAGYPLHVTDTNHSNKRVHRIISELRTAQHVKIIEPDKPVKYVLRLLDNNQFVAYLADQNARAAGIFIDFFGRPAWTLRGPAVFAIRRRCPIVACFMIREGIDRHRAVFEEPLWPDPTLDGEEAVIELTQRFTRVLEDYIRKYPELYFWTHRRWKTQPKTVAA